MRSVMTQVIGLANHVSAVSGGNAFSCAMLNSGGVKCWGDDSYGTLGKTVDILRSSHEIVPTQAMVKRKLFSTTPVMPVGLSAKVTFLASSNSRLATCVIQENVTKCFGSVRNRIVIRLPQTNDGLTP